MPTKTKAPTLIAANLSYEQMEQAIPKINRRIADLNELEEKIESINGPSEPTVSALSSRLEELITSIFGYGTVEYERYRHKVSGLGLTTWWPEMPVYKMREQIQSHIASSRAQLEAIKKDFEEALEDGGRTASGKALKAYDGLELHPKIEEVASRLFRDGHYANAIEDAVKALNDLVRLNSGINDKDGDQLMKQVFNPNNPVLQFNALIDDSDRNEQRGFMELFSGAVAGLRNPRAHKIIRDDPERTLEFIAFVSLLAKLADEAKR